MNTLIYYSFSVLFVCILVLIVGMIKPKWVFLWMEKPGRLPVLMVALALFMVFAVMFGEGNKQLQQEKAQQIKQQTTQQPGAEVPDLH
ncbi:hypothetical protein NP590_10235 [Methylomonas sp. SURF-2]|uniref:Uncharacterized protein n=1 Tax=Methylomonas subterranea TaxID=2952225 RepID=A0ABT1TG93_9GAMM|nr:hypothetical protein [Methylomonas sp. SURF-2]MCQ8104481.1 hypothetical protein [Methylomonas sp. SURF-2]